MVIDTQIEMLVARLSELRARRKQEKRDRIRPSRISPQATERRRRVYVARRKGQLFREIAIAEGVTTSRAQQIFQD